LQRHREDGELAARLATRVHRRRLTHLRPAAVPRPGRREPLRLRAALPAKRALLRREPPGAPDARPQPASPGKVHQGNKVEAPTPPPGLQQPNQANRAQIQGLLQQRAQPAQAIGESPNRPD